MIREIATLLAPLGLLALATSPALAGGFEIVLKVGPPDHPVSTTETVETPAAKELPPRPVVELACDKPVRVSWHAENTSDSEEFEDVLVHCFVVEEKKAGQPDVAPLTEDVTYESALTADFNPHDDAGGWWMLTIHDAGTYLLRVEAIGTAESHGHEHCAAMDLIVK